MEYHSEIVTSPHHLWLMRTFTFLVYDSNSVSRLVYELSRFVFRELLKLKSLFSRLVYELSRFVFRELLKLKSLFKIIVFGDVDELPRRMVSSRQRSFKLFVRSN
ncbi:hypothetical protein YC2023_053278 [Brassica napus]